MVNISKNVDYKQIYENKKKKKKKKKKRRLFMDKVQLPRG